MREIEWPKARTIGEWMEEIRRQEGAKEYSGHEYFDLNRFAEDTHHMVIFDVLSEDSPVGWKGERTRAYLTEAGYGNVLSSQEKGHIRILSHARVNRGRLAYDSPDSLR